MYRLVYFIIILMFTFSGAFTALAATASPSAIDNQREIVYRTNLGRADDVKLLIGKGVSPNAVDDNGAPLLALAAARKDDEGINVVKALIEAGADVNAKDLKGQTPLFYAAKQGNKAAVEYLLTHGADYYALDSEGNIARNVAYTHEHKDVAAAMDQFVKDETEKRRKQYEDLNKIIEERYKELQKPPVSEYPPQPQAPVQTAPTPMPEEDAKAKAAEEADKAREAEELTRQAEERKAHEAEEKAKQEEEHRIAEAAAIKQQEALAKLSAELSFDNCAFQYWYYCDSVRQSTELTQDKLNDEIEAYRSKVLELNRQMRDDYKATPNMINTIADSAKKRIYNQLNVMSSNIERREQGVGNAKDMHERCERIARDWDTEPPKYLANPPASRGRSGGGIGGGTMNMPTLEGPSSSGFVPVINKPPAPRYGREQDNTDDKSKK